MAAFFYAFSLNRLSMMFYCDPLFVKGFFVFYGPCFGRLVPASTKQKCTNQKYRMYSKVIPLLYQPNSLFSSENETLLILTSSKCVHAKKEKRINLFIFIRLPHCIQHVNLDVLPVPHGTVKYRPIDLPIQNE